MASEKQKELFNRLADEREFPAGSPPPSELKARFADVPDASASDWIERALALPKRGEVPPPF